MDTGRLADLTPGAPTPEVGAPSLSHNVAQPTVIYKVELGLLKNRVTQLAHTDTPLASVPL
jgi:hypothetical protein